MTEQKAIVDPNLQQNLKEIFEVLNKDNPFFTDYDDKRRGAPKAGFSFKQVFYGTPIYNLDRDYSDDEIAEVEFQMRAVYEHLFGFRATLLMRKSRMGKTGEIECLLLLYEFNLYIDDLLDALTNFAQVLDSDDLQGFIEDADKEEMDLALEELGERWEQFKKWLARIEEIIAKERKDLAKYPLFDLSWNFHNFDYRIADNMRDFDRIVKDLYSGERTKVFKAEQIENEKEE